MTTMERLRSAFSSLRLMAIDARLEGLLENTAKKESSYGDFLLEVVSTETDARRQRYLKTRLQLAHLPYVKTFDQFEFSFQPSIDERQIRELRMLRFVHEASNMILLGPPGVGKTHLAVALAETAIQSGQAAYFMTAHDLVTDLGRAYREGRLDRRLRIYLAPFWLIAFSDRPLGARASMRSPGSRAWSFPACLGSQTARGSPCVRESAPFDVAFRLVERRQHPECNISQLNTRPVGAPVNASMAALRLATHDSGSGWFAGPFLYDSFIHYSTGYPGALNKFLIFQSERAHTQASPFTYYLLPENIAYSPHYVLTRELYHRIDYPVSDEIGRRGLQWQDEQPQAADPSFDSTN